jgi:predicted AlkP superfamily pyrophosphatase or phosphodiesterase
MRFFPCASLATFLIASPVHAKPARGHRGEDSSADHVLLVSVDGLHALDVARFIQDHPHSALAELSRHGVTYSNARLPSNSDSFPGLLALVTGGSPVSHGIFYDVSYDRKLFDPANTGCVGSPGNAMVFDESVPLPPLPKEVFPPVPWFGVVEPELGHAVSAAKALKSTRRRTAPPLCPQCRQENLWRATILRWPMRQRRVFNP